MRLNYFKIMTTASRISPAEINLIHLSCKRDMACKKSVFFAVLGVFFMTAAIFAALHKKDKWVFYATLITGACSLGNSIYNCRQMISFDEQLEQISPIRLATFPSDIV